MCGKDVKGWENGVDEANFLVRNDGENRRHKNRNYGEIGESVAVGLS